MPPVAELQAASDFPANQASALNAFKAAIAEYPPAPAASPGTKGIQDLATSDWQTGGDAAGRQTARISAPTLIADGTSDQLDPVANDRTLARIIPGATLVLYPDAGHAFLFQDWTRFAALVNSFLAGNPSS
jgi:pimeloyl-ACP methyl ester carboxylesterase